VGDLKDFKVDGDPFGDNDDAINMLKIGLVIILIGIGVILFYLFLTGDGGKECQIDSECSYGYYCGKNYFCNNIDGKVIGKGACVSELVQEITSKSKFNFILNSNNSLNIWTDSDKLEKVCGYVDIGKPCYFEGVYLEKDKYVNTSLINCNYGNESSFPIEVFSERGFKFDNEVDVE